MQFWLFAENIEFNNIREKIENWFGVIQGSYPQEINIELLAFNKASAKKIIEKELPLEAMYMAFKIPSRIHPDYYACDLLSDVLCNGQSSRLYRHLLKDQTIFSQVDAYVSGSREPGLLVIEGKLTEGTNMEMAIDAVWEQIELIKSGNVSEKELEKLKNRVESNHRITETSVFKPCHVTCLLRIPGRSRYDQHRTRKIQTGEARRPHPCLPISFWSNENLCLLTYRHTKS